MPNRNTQFKEYLNENVNLITILGIFNGLSVYSSTLDDDAGKYILGFIFTVCSVMILRELILEVPKEQELHIPLISFVISLCGVWLFLVYSIFKNYTSSAGMLLSVIILGIAFYLLFKFDNRQSIRNLERKYPKMYELLFPIFLITTVLISIALWIYAWEFIQSFFELIPSKKIIYS